MDAGCIGKDVKVSLLDTGDNLLGTELDGRPPPRPRPLTVTPSVVAASAVAKLAVVISG